MQSANLSQSIKTIAGIGDKTYSKFLKLGVSTVQDLLFYTPVKYRDTRNILTVKEFLALETGTFKATIEKVSAARRGRYFVVNVLAQDSTGTIRLVWFNQPYILQTLKKGNQYLFYGKMSKGVVNQPKFEIIKDNIDTKTLGKLISIYNATSGVSSLVIRSKIKLAMTDLDDTLPQNIRKEQGMIDITDAIHKIHFPKSEQDIEEAKKRLAFDELLSILLDVELKKKLIGKGKTPVLKHGKYKQDIEEFIKTLEFKLTTDQNQAIKDMFDDFSSGKPMRRLLNGDVGSGKTVVAFIAAYLLYLAGYSIVFMAPTTILAQQHYETFLKYAKKSSIKSKEIALVISKSKKNLTDKRLVIGTHALLYDCVLPKETLLVIVDEQHRFGVKQRESLLKGKEFHYLSMTATPIPRTLANILYGDMEVSYIKSMPIDRLPIKTHLVPEEKREECLKWIANQVRKNKDQAYIVYPVIEQSSKIETRSLINSYEQLKSDIFFDLKVGLLHGRMEDKEKERVINEFKKGGYDIIISTTVVEVGIDVPNATIMLIEGAQQFGLAQLHQLRGRVGRGRKQSYCFVIPNKASQDSSKRLKFFAKNSNGFDLAEFDLENRGPGQVFGVLQAGIPEFKIADIMNISLVKKYKQVAKEIVDNNTKEQIKNIKEGLFR